MVLLIIVCRDYTRLLSRDDYQYTDDDGVTSLQIDQFQIGRFSGGSLLPSADIASGPDLSQVDQVLLRIIPPS